MKLEEVMLLQRTKSNQRTEKGQAKNKKKVEWCQPSFKPRPGHLLMDSKTELMMGQTTQSFT